MAAVRVLILRAPGTNCDREAEHAWELAGAAVERLHISEVRDNPNRLLEYQVLTLPGGFSYGDDISAGRIFASQIERHLGNALREFVAKGRLVLGICNGFQVLAKLGMLPATSGHWQVECTLAHNQPAGFQDRWIAIRAEVDHCPFLEPGRVYEMPIAHGEGRVVFADEAARQRAITGRHVALRYVAAPAAGMEACGDVRPNPNASELDAAGLCDTTGRVLGLMPHPERFVRATQHPCWTSRGSEGDGDGLAIFRAAVAALR